MSVYKSGSDTLIYDIAISNAFLVGSLLYFAYLPQTLCFCSFTFVFVFGTISFTYFNVGLFSYYTTTGNFCWVLRSMVKGTGETSLGIL